MNEHIPQTNGKEVKIAVLQEQMRVVQEDVTKIKDNHLPHIYAKLGSIEKKLAYYTGVAAAAGIAANAFINHFFK